MLAIDVSENNGDINWDAVVEDGIKVVFVRVGYGEGHEDSRFREYADAAHAHGLKVGAYWFSYACDLDQAYNEGKYCRQIIDDWGGCLEYRVYIDQEGSDWRNNNGFKYEELTDMCRRFNEGLSGLNVGVYANLSWFNNMDIEALKSEGFDIWFSRPDVKYPEIECGIWQYSFTHIIDGKEFDINTLGE